MGGSNASRLELEAIFTPPYNAARHGIYFTASPVQADVILLMSSGTASCAEHAMRLLAGLPEDVKLVALGSDALRAAPFAGAYAVAGPLETEGSRRDTELKLPTGKSISAYLVGSPPDPQAIIQAILSLYE